MGTFDYHHKTEYYREKSADEVHGGHPLANLVGGAIGSLLVYCVPWGLVYVWLLDHSMGEFIGTVFRTMFFGNGVVWGSVFWVTYLYIFMQAFNSQFFEKTGEYNYHSRTWWN